MTEEEKKDLAALRFTLNSSLALLSTKFASSEDGWKFASAVLDVPGFSPADQAKVLYRGAIAERGLGDFDATVGGLEEVCRLTLSDEAIGKELEVLRHGVGDPGRE